MDKIRNYDISFAGLKNGKHEFKFKINQAFFNLFDTEKEFTDSEITAKVLLEKHTTFLDLYIEIDGTVELTCDVSNKLFDHPIHNDLKVLVKYGEEYDDSDPEVITIPHNEGVINVAQLIYEDVVLSIPMKKESPQLAENPEYEALLEKFSPKEADEAVIDQIDEEAIDPRWEALKKLKGKNK